MEYAYLLLAYLKNECRLYIAYIGQKGTKEKKGMNIAFFDERKTGGTYKKKNLYIFIYRQKEKAGKNRYKRTQKKRD